MLEIIQNIDESISKPSSFSFPSGHTGFSFAATGVLAKYFRKYRIPLFILASLMAFQGFIYVFTILQIL